MLMCEEGRHAPRERESSMGWSSLPYPRMAGPELEAEEDTDAEGTRKPEPDVTHK